MKWLNPLTWSSLALQIVGGAILFIALAFLGNWWLEDYYTKDLKEAQAQATAKADAERLKREAQNNERIIKAKNAQIKTLEAIAADGKRIDDANQRMQHNLRASEAARTELSACLQRADTLDTVQRSISEFAGRVAQEADKHVSDKIACHEAWPE